MLGRTCDWTCSLHALSRAFAGAAAFDASYVLAFMLAGTFLVYAVLILVMRNVFVREEKEGKLRPNKADAATAAPAATTPTNAPAVRRLLFCQQAGINAKQQQSAADTTAIAQGAARLSTAASCEKDHQTDAVLCPSAMLSMMLPASADCHWRCASKEAWLVWPQEQGRCCCSCHRHASCSWDPSCLSRPPWRQCYHCC